MNNPVPQSITLRRFVSLISLVMAASTSISHGGQLCQNGGGEEGLITGTVSKSGVVAPAGKVWSETQHDYGNTSVSNIYVGLNCTFVRCVDDFHVPPGGWIVSGFEIFQFKQGSSTILSALDAKIWGPCPLQSAPGEPGCAIIADNDFSLKILSQSPTPLLRIQNSLYPTHVPPFTTGIVQKISVQFAQSAALPEGRYWLDYRPTSADQANIYTPLLVIPNRRSHPTWNLHTTQSGNYAPLTEFGNPVTKPYLTADMPFSIIGYGAPSISCGELIFQSGSDFGL